MKIEKKPYPENAISIIMPVGHIGTFKIGGTDVNFGYTNKGIEFHVDAVKTTYIISWEELSNMIMIEVAKDMEGLNG